MTDYARALGALGIALSAFSAGVAALQPTAAIYGLAASNALLGAAQVYGWRRAADAAPSKG